MGHTQSKTMAEVTLTSKDEREFKVNAQVAIMSETVKSMMGVEDGDEIDPPEAAIPLPAVEGNILELVLKYCNYHYENKETKEDEKNAWDQEFVKVDDDTLFSLIWLLTTSTSSSCWTSPAKLWLTTLSSVRHHRRS